MEVVRVVVVGVREFVMMCLFLEVEVLDSLSQLL